MSNTLAIAAVTSTIRYVLDRALGGTQPGPVGGANVTTLRPDRLTDADLVTTPGINVYLYDVRPNHAWNLTDLPTRGTDGGFVRRPVVALDLHYLLTYYGVDESLDAQRLLGRAVLALAATPVLTSAVVTRAKELYQGEVDTTFLAESDLADQVERVKIAPYVLSVEEMSKLWTTFGTPHQLSQTYVATAALVEAEVTPRRALPVLRRTVTVVAGGPVTLAALDTDPPGGSVEVGTAVGLRGSGLLARPGQTTRVRIGGVTVPVASGGTAQRLDVTVGGTVPAGLHSVRVEHLSAAPQRTVAASNALPLLVRPVVTVVSGPPSVRLGIDPPLAAGQRATVLLSGPGTYSVRLPPLPPDEAPLAELTVPVDDLGSGTWLVRVQVDGVDSVPSLVGDVYGAPVLTVP